MYNEGVSSGTLSARADLLSALERSVRCCLTVHGPGRPLMQGVAASVHELHRCIMTIRLGLVSTNSRSWAFLEVKIISR